MAKMDGMGRTAKERTELIDRAAQADGVRPDVIHALGEARIRTLLMLLTPIYGFLNRLVREALDGAADAYADLFAPDGADGDAGDGDDAGYVTELVAQGVNRITRFVPELRAASHKALAFLLLFNPRAVEEDMEANGIVGADTERVLRLLDLSDAVADRLANVAFGIEKFLTRLAKLRINPEDGRLVTSGTGDRVIPSRTIKKVREWARRNGFAAGRNDCAFDCDALASFISAQTGLPVVANTATVSGIPQLRIASPRSKPVESLTPIDRIKKLAESYGGRSIMAGQGIDSYFLCGLQYEGLEQTEVFAQKYDFEATRVQTPTGETQLLIRPVNY